MTAIAHNPDNIHHAQPGHPEHPGRYTAIIEALGKVGLLAQMPSVNCRPAENEEILRAHRQDLIDRIEATVRSGGGMLDPDTYCTSQSWNIAREAAGGLIDLCTAVADGQHPNGLALLRPPGHHATGALSMGFCLINQAAIATRALQAAGLATKVAIIDIDVHHGNGTEDIFYEDETVFYISTHQFPHYPGTGRATDQGIGRGQGFTLNLPLPAGSHDSTIVPVYTDTIVPALQEFGPDFLIVSAGYDAHRDDPLAGLLLSTEGYMEICRCLTGAADRLCEGKIVFTLEGGYNLDVLATCVTDTVRILLDSASEDPPVSNNGHPGATE